MKKYGAVYLAAVGGAGAYLSKRILSAEIVDYPELGPEALLKLEVKDFPCIVAIDCYGNDIYRR
jgi:fumarate hydratase subunit beta